jgi:hypothetical protein
MSAVGELGDDQVGCVGFHLLLGPFARHHNPETHITTKMAKG